MHTVAGREDHVHVLLTSEAEGEAVRRWLKTWLGQAMNEHWPRPEAATWWAQCGSVKRVWMRSYFGRAFNYIEQQRTTP